MSELTGAAIELGPIARSEAQPVRLGQAITISLPERRLPERERGGFRPSLPYIAGRTFVWVLMLVRLAALATWDALRRRGSRRRNAARLRTMMQQLGATAIKIGQQLAVRTDVLPREYCEELEGLLDDVPPFPFETARQILEEDTGAPLAATFRRFDPNPIGSGSIACVFRAELRSGEVVAVKIRRPEIGSRLTSDMNVLQGIGWLCEAVGLSRSGKWSPVLLEIRRMLLDELDFILEARQIEAFRRDTRKVKHLSAPKVYFELTNARILVTEFVEGVAVKELIEVVAANDLRRLAELKARGFDPIRISRRWVRIFFWQIFDAKLFHADPHPANIIIRPGNEIVIIDFGSCGNLSRDYRRNMFNLNMALIRSDQYEAVDCIVATAEPLPPIDIDRYTAELQSVVRKAILAINSKHAPWQEKTSGGVWREVMEVAQRYDIPLRADALRYFRANLLSESMAYRLHPDLNPVDEFEVFTRRRAERLRRKALRRQRREREQGCDPAGFERLREVTEKTVQRVERDIEQTRYAFRTGVSKAAYALGAILRTAGAVVTIFLVSVLVRSLTGNVPTLSGTAEFLHHSAAVATKFWFWIACAVFALTTVRKILFKAGEVDVEERRK